MQKITFTMNGISTWLTKNIFDMPHNVEKEKVQHSGVRKSNGSRANIPLFKMVTKKSSWGSKNIDYWENVKDKIEDASSVDGAYQW